MNDACEKIDQLIVTGHGAEARRLLTEALTKKVARTERITLARLARRAHAHTVALRLLNPIVHPKGKSISDATDAEKAEYAASLTFVGAAEEALALLKKVDTTITPEALLFEAFALFSQWNYGDAIPLLTHYVDSTKISDYQRVVGNVNLAAALVYEREFAKAKKLLQSLLSSTKSQFQLLYGNCLELAAQNSIHQGDWQSAEAHLEKCENLLEGKVGLDRMDILKWKALMHFVRHPKDIQAIKELHRIRKEAFNEGYWETVRDCDRYEAIYRRDPDLLTHNYFGSPYAAFRWRLLNDFENKEALPTEYHWIIGGQKRCRGSFDLLSARDSISKKQLKVGQALHRLLTALSSDFYRPLRVAVAHAKIFPGEFYNPLTSPPRVYEIVRRLRSWLIKARVPLNIEENSGFYRLVPTSPYAIVLHNIQDIGKRDLAIERQLKERWPSDGFTCKEAAKFLNISPTSMRRFLESLLDKHVHERTGQTTTVRYRVK